MRPAQRRQQGLQYGVLLLGMQAMNYGIDKIPPVTLITIIGQVLLYVGLIKVPWNAEEVCISTIKVFKHRNWKSFLVSNFEHGSDMHLYYNMISLILKGSYLEPMYGTMNFAFLLIILSLGCSTMYIILGYILMQLTGDYAYYTQCAIGFSSVLFALKLIVVCEEQDRVHNVGGFRVPSKIAVWVELILIHLLVPQSSFIGHLGGIFVGCLYCYTFIGEIVDNLLYNLSKNPIIHEEEFYRRRSLFSFSFSN
ncbi:rhomboid-related protein 4 [Ptiloglossa arizonensis]|uniref:rhomboid-related protein 4 n=1 Tax=Ptiloglossa arizonensis TaxID=3350558 RepID=UPI003F9F7031